MRIIGIYKGQIIAFIDGANIQISLVPEDITDMTLIESYADLKVFNSQKEIDILLFPEYPHH